MSEELPKTLKSGAMAEMIGVTERQFRNIMRDARVRPVSRGLWPVAEAVQGALNVARGSRQTSEVAQAQARSINAKARQLEIATAKAERELIPIEDAIEILDYLVGTVRSELGWFPARVTRDMALRKKIEDEINAAQERIAEAFNTATGVGRTGEDIPYEREGNAV